MSGEVSDVASRVLSRVPKLPKTRSRVVLAADVPRDAVDLLLPSPWCVHKSSSTGVFEIRRPPLLDEEYPWAEIEVENAFIDAAGSAPAAAVILGVSTRNLRLWLLCPKYQKLTVATMERLRVKRYHEIDTGARRVGTEIRDQRAIYGTAEAERDAAILQEIAVALPGCVDSIRETLIRLGNGRTHPPVSIWRLLVRYQDDVHRTARLLELLTALDWITPPL